jgi:simple sugar transport system permease protein
VIRFAVASALPILAALALSAAGLLAVGVDPIDYYGIVLERGLLTSRGLQETLTRMAPLLLLAASLIISFSAGLWNLGVEGQFLLAAVSVAAACPLLADTLGQTPALMIGAVIAGLVGGGWALLPAWLRAAYGVNEIITTLMMSFLGTSLANVLVKLVFADPGSTVPQTRTLPVDDRLPRLFGTTVHVGVPLAMLALLATHWMITQTSWGLRLRVFGASPRAAAHVGIPADRTIIGALVISGALAGLAGGVDIMGVFGNVRADWNPAYGLTVIPIVFLSRLNGFAVAGFVLLLSVLAVGAQSASIRLGVPSYYSLVLVALILVFLALGDRLLRGGRVESD